MSRLLSALLAEHERILGVIAALRAFAARHAAEDPDARATLGHFVRLLRDYADDWHHGKEEDLLFEAMVQAGLPRHAGPVACMLAEHDEGRHHVDALAALAAGTGPLSPDERKRLVLLADDYADVLVPHIAKENQVLYPMARRVLSAERLASLDEAAEAFGRYRGRSTGDELEALGRSLESRYRA